MIGAKWSRREVLVQGLGWVTVSLGAGAAGAAVVSGPQVGQRPLPFTSNLVTGPYRGKQHCYVCEMKDELAVLVFARKLDEPTGRLLTELRDALRENQKALAASPTPEVKDGKKPEGKPAKLFGWLVFLGNESTASETALERQAQQFAAANAATAVPISVLGDPAGPPGYQIAADAAVTLIVFRNGKTLYNRAYTAKEWSKGAAEKALKELPKLLGAAGASA